MKKRIWTAFLIGVLKLSAQEESVGAETVGELPPIEKMPELVEFKEANYPDSLIKKGVEGTVETELIVDEKGHVEGVKVVRGFHPTLDSSALHAIKQFKFSPAIAGGDSVAVAIAYQYQFTLQTFVQEIQEYVNLKGRLVEKGTRSPVAEGLVVVQVVDESADSTIKIPMKNYLEKIGDFDGQFIEDNSIVTQTDDRGYFQFKSLPSGKVKITFPITGYQPAALEEDVVKNQMSEIEVSIYRESYDDYEINVYGKAEKKDVAKKTLSIQEVKRVPGFAGDAIKVLQALPGVARPTFGSGEIILRGSGTEDNRYYLDGVQLPRLYHVFGIKSIYNSDFLGSLEMYPGGFGTRYGGAVGGIAEIKGRKAKMDRWHGSVDVNLIDANASFEGPINNDMGLQIAGRRSYLGEIMEKQTENLPTTLAPFYWDGLVRLDWKLNDKHDMFFTYNTAFDKLKLIDDTADGGKEDGEGNSSGIDIKMWYQMGIFGLNSQFSKNWSNELRLAAYQTEEKQNFFNFFDIDVKWQALSVRDELSWKMNEHLKWNYGLDLSLVGVQYDLDILSSVGYRTNDIDKDFSDYGVYTNMEIKPFENWLIIPGVRYDYFEDVDKGAPSYRLTSRLEYAKGKVLKGSAGTYNQTPKPGGQATDSVWGNPEIGLTKAQHYVFGHEWDMTDLISLDAQVYYNLQQNIPRFTDSINPVTDERYNLIDDMDGRMYGLEVMLKHDQGKRFFGWVSYTLSRSERRAPGPTTPDYVNGGNSWDPDEWVLFTKDQTHNLQLVASWRLGKRWETGIRAVYTTGDPTTPILGYTSNQFEYSVDDGEYAFVAGKPYSDRVGDHFELDYRLDYKMIFDNWIGAFYLDFKNISGLFYDSPEIYEYNYDGSERKTVSNIFIPSFGFKADF